MRIRTITETPRDITARAHPGKGWDLSGDSKINQINQIINYIFLQFIKNNL